MGKEDKSLPPKDRNKQDDIKWPDEEEIRSNRLKAPALPDRRDTLEIGVYGFPPARFELIKTGRRSLGWRPTHTNQLAA